MILEFDFLKHFFSVNLKAYNRPSSTKNLLFEAGGKRCDDSKGPVILRESFLQNILKIHVKVQNCNFSGDEKFACRVHNEPIGRWPQRQSSDFPCPVQQMCAQLVWRLVAFCLLPSGQGIHRQGRHRQQPILSSAIRTSFGRRRFKFNFPIDFLSYLIPTHPVHRCCEKNQYHGKFQDFEIT